MNPVYICIYTRVYIYIYIIYVPVMAIIYTESSLKNFRKSHASTPCQFPVPPGHGGAIMGAAC